MRVAVPASALDSFDYLLPPGYAGPALCPGMRVRVGFAGRRLIGIVTGQGRHSAVPAQRLRPILKVLDQTPILGHRDLELLCWASRYYHWPLGRVINAVLPKALRRGNAAAVIETPLWKVSPLGKVALPANLQRAPKQRALLELLKTHPPGLDAARIAAEFPHWRQPLAGLVNKGLVTEATRPRPTTGNFCSPPAPRLNAHQDAASRVLLTATGRFAPFVLEGVTGSGKTEVYLKVIHKVLADGRQTLLLLPEIALTPQTVARFRARLGVPLAVMHSALSDGERHRAWHMARGGEAPIIIGTRSAVFTPLAAPGLIIVDEEHDNAFKQQEGFRYHARDIAVVRASRLGVPVILGSATPSLETLRNVERGRYRRLRLPERARAASPPVFEVVDVRRRPLQAGLSPYVLSEVRRHLESDGQVLVFLNRRGYAPALLCHSCGWVAGCARCDANLTLHVARNRLCCHHCGAEREITMRCPVCDSADLLRLGEGTERVERMLKSIFPSTSIVRVDRDTTRRKGDLQDKLAGIERGAHRLLIGTQMLSKGHDFPNVTLAVILSVDQSLYSGDFRASERAAQLIIQVAGRAGRGERAGRVLLQTHRPDHPLINALLAGGYSGFSHTALLERRSAGLPPYCHLALLRAEAISKDAPAGFLHAARALISAESNAEVTLLGPAPAPMERRAGRYRAQLLLLAKNRHKLQRLLHRCVPQLGGLAFARAVRWALDIDPMEML